MKSMMLAAALVCVAPVAFAQGTVPDLKGTWVSKGRSVVIGTNPHHPGTQTIDSPPRVREFEFTMVVEGQDGRLAWGRSSSTVANTREPFAWAISADGRTIVGSDTDGSYYMTVQSADLVEMCYTHSGLSPSKSIVATCSPMTRRR